MEVVHSASTRCCPAMQAAISASSRSWTACRSAAASLSQEASGFRFWLARRVVAAAGAIDSGHPLVLRGDRLAGPAFVAGMLAGYPRHIAFQRELGAATGRSSLLQRLQEQPASGGWKPWHSAKKMPGNRSAH
jgi:hypothetical protein